MPTTVLIVDDHASFRASMRRLLEIEGYVVVGEAADGQAALRAAEALHPDLMLLDVHLPDLDGFEVAARVTATVEPPAVVLISSRDASDFGPKVAASGARGFVSKDELDGNVLEELLE